MLSPISVVRTASFPSLHAKSKNNFMTVVSGLLSNDSAPRSQLSGLSHIKMSLPMPGGTQDNVLWSQWCSHKMSWEILGTLFNISCKRMVSHGVKNFISFTRFVEWKQRQNTALTLCQWGRLFRNSSLKMPFAKSLQPWGFGTSMEPWGEVPSLYMWDLCSHLLNISGCCISPGRWGEGQCQVSYLQLYSTNKSLAYNPEDIYFSKAMYCIKAIGKLQPPSLMNPLYYLYCKMSLSGNSNTNARVEVRVPSQHMMTNLTNLRYGLIQYSLGAFSLCSSHLIPCHSALSCCSLLFPLGIYSALLAGKYLWL